jgi:TetR/AcrR family transcriptional regulator, transcriptional repressor for nem operon
MRVTRAEAEKNRERIIETAARLFRERGFDGIGVAELMKVVGLTHGGFYGNFSSKEDLMAQACEHAMKRSLDALQQAAEQAGEHALSAIASTYLSDTHRDHPADGCVLAALGAESPRHDSPVRSVFTKGVRSVVDALTKLLPGESTAKKRERAIAVYASMVGAMVLARAVDDAELSEEILKSVLASIAPPESP